MYTDSITGVYVTKIPTYCLKVMFDLKVKVWCALRNKIVEHVVCEESDASYYTEMILIWFFTELTKEEKPSITQKKRNLYLLLAEQCHDTNNRFLSDYNG
jgi:hypothetical protein